MNLTIKNFKKLLFISCPNIDKKKIISGISNQSASLVLLTSGKNEIFIVLTKRSNTLRLHPGQVSLPGGKPDLKDNDFGETARRETEEEIGISQKNMTHLGYLSSVLTNSNYLIIPSVSFCSINSDQILSKLKLSENEVEKVWLVPLKKIIDLKSYVKVNSRNSNTVYWKIKGTSPIIWGASALILKNFAIAIKNKNSNLN